MRPNNLNISEIHAMGFKSKASALFMAILLGLISPLTLKAHTLDIPLFEATYDIRMNGLPVGKAQFSIKKVSENTYLYKQRSKAKGFASWFRKEKVTESSLWEIHNNAIRPIEYHYTKTGSDDDEEDHIRFDWETKTAVNTNPTEPWSLEMPEGTLDKLMVQVAMLLDLQNGETSFKYPIADNGRIKYYEFGVLGEEIIDVPGGEFKAIKLQRLNDDRDTTYIWTTPDLKHLPVLFLKIKKNGLKLEIRLRKIQMEAL